VRPAHKVILYGVNDDERGLIAFALANRLRLDVRQCLDAQQIAGQLRGNPPTDEYGIRMLVFIHEGRTVPAITRTLSMLGKIQKAHPDLPILLVDMPKIFGDNAPATVKLAGIVAPLVLIETVKTLTARKRGPKPRSAEACASAA